MILIFYSAKISFKSINNSNMRTKLFLILLIVTLPLEFVISSGLNTSGGKKAQNKKPVNIIILIGDGMGPAELSAGIAVSENTFFIERFPYAGFCKTSSSDNYVTDSGAAGTAIACGIKTRKRMIGLGPDSSVVASIMEVAHRNGLSTGIVSTSSITDATPASFAAHNSNRDNYEEIASDFMNGAIDVFIGGGLDYFNRRKDNIDLTANLKENGYDVVYSIEDLMKSKSLKIAGLLARQHMEKANQGRIGKLESMTQKAIEVLSKNKKGFILMVEGSQIDKAGHAHDIEWLTSEVIDFDRSVGVAYEFAQKNSNTLVVVTADHETGGLTLPGGNLEERTIRHNFGSKDHTAVMVPAFSYGPGAERFSGIHENTFFFNEFIDLLGLKK